MNIFISAGDPSGDVHAANLVLELKKLSPGLTVAALGGCNLERVSDSFLVNLVNLGGFGFWQPFKLYFKLMGLLKGPVLDSWNTAKPDKVVLVDYYGFNIYIAKEAFKRGIPVYYYISPQVWATRPGRIKKIAEYVKKMLVILPFEEKLYRGAGVDTVFVGHPLLDMVPAPSTAKHTGKDKLTIGLFPGSRLNVFRRHINILIDAAKIVSSQTPADFKIFCAAGLKNECAGLPYPCVVEDNYEERSKIDFAVTTSGTVSLENALLGIPMLVYYKLSSFNYFIAKLLANVRYITMVNILLDKMLVPELLQKDASPEKIAKTTMDIVKDSKALNSYKEELLGLRKLLGSPGASARAASIILS